jgi:hypothetical protein
MGEAPGPWPEIAGRLGAVEDRYLAERPRAGHGARYLSPAEEEAVMEDVRRACDLYPRSGDAERAGMRAFFAGAYTLAARLWKAHAERARSFVSKPSPGSLLRALIPLSLEDAVTDSRDTILAIRSILDTAAASGIDFETVRSQVVSLSSSRFGKLFEGSRPPPEAPVR